MTQPGIKSFEVCAAAWCRVDTGLVRRDKAASALLSRSTGNTAAQSWERAKRERDKMADRSSIWVYCVLDGIPFRGVSVKETWGGVTLKVPIEEWPFKEVPTRPNQNVITLSRRYIVSEQFYRAALGKEGEANGNL